MVTKKKKRGVSFIAPFYTKVEMATFHGHKQSYVTEFRNYEDGAWYTVTVTLQEKETLRVGYEEFTDGDDNLFEQSSFDSLEKLHEFEKRFRPLSIQAQDHECHKLVHGVRVCASLHFNSDDLRFYDAVVDRVRSISKLF